MGSGGGRTQSLAVQLRPQGVLYARLTLARLQAAPAPRGPRVFGVDLGTLVAREGSPGLVPVIVTKCLDEIERRGLKVVGLYRLCGSAAAKKELREAFERDSEGVTLSQGLYPDISVVVGLYRPCGSAAAKKELREAFERDSEGVTLSQGLYPDISVVTGEGTPGDT
ncbi:hypothetical protein HGM15179_021864 [Zosterops borbonicus]|uniref:Rho-GAP domain-containing protein n=1 Tax=Zosterops borbonicus TaxID=364589 RepID=A0A8K1FTM6_9PASS|nr:hypothetical protein HGM15179_021864 [Zosterops borbonicus]